MKVTMDHIHLRCSDPEAALSFYMDNFEAERVREFEAGGMPVTLLRMGGTLVAISPPRPGVEVTVPDGEPAWGVYQIGLQVEDLDKAQAELAAKGIEFCRGPVQVDDHLKVGFIDAPDGVEIELMEMS